MDQNLTREKAAATKRAYALLSAHDRENIDRVSLSLRNKMRERVRGITLGKTLALEVLAALGMWLNSHDVVDNKEPMGIMECEGANVIT